MREPMTDERLKAIEQFPWVFMLQNSDMDTILNKGLGEGICKAIDELLHEVHRLKALTQQWQPIETRPSGATAWFVTPKDMPQILLLGTWKNGVHKSTNWLRLPNPPEQTEVIADAE